MSLAILVPLLVLGVRPMPFQMSVQAWTFHQFTAFEAIEKVAATGSANIELFPGQKLKPGSDIGVGPEMGNAATDDLKAQLVKFNLKAVAFGVTGIDKDPAKADALFVWAKSLGIGIINTESTDAMDTIEAMVKRHDMRVGFHNHPKQEGNANYKVWDPAYVYEIVKNRDSRIGACADTGHWVRSGIAPVDAIKTLKGRIVSSHLKDLNVFSREAHDVPYGTGVSKIADVLAAYDKIGMTGSVSVEYEHNWQDNGREVAQCIGFVRGLYAR